MPQITSLRLIHKDQKWMNSIGVINMKIDKIETQRLFLRNYVKSDMGFAMSIWNDPEMGKYLPDPMIDNIDDEYCKSIETLDEYEPCCYLISESKETESGHVALFQA